MSAVRELIGFVVRNFLIALALVVLGTAGCNQSAATLATANLLAVDDLSLVCVQTDGSNRIYVEQGRPIEECSEGRRSDRRLLALATQRETGEVAVLNATSCGYPSRNSQQPCSATMVDVESAQPGLNFLPVGAEPIGIVSTPGGTASFTAVAEPGKAGIFGLPSTCVGARKRGGQESQAVRDIRTWPACRLPVAPGSIALFRAQARETLRCDQEPDAEDQAERECPADLSVESRRGRLKLAVTLPQLGQLWTFDAQEVLDRSPGSYSPCSPESIVELQTQRPNELTQELPSDLSSEVKVYSELASSFVSTPTDIASDLNANHGLMYVADRTAPIVHVVDTKDACNVRELEGLYPVSYTEPTEVIATRKVAISPVVDSGARYVYAIEESTRATAGSVMVFDVSPNGPMQRTPQVLPGAKTVPDQTPDRLALGGVQASDVEFIFRDPEVVGDDGVSVSGLRCLPDPADDDSAGALFRPSSGVGASPDRLRGLFAMVSLHTGTLAMVDVDDYDAACRRPSSVGHTEGEGCPGDSEIFDERVSELNDDDTTRVTAEVSCNVVSPHRVRARTFYTETEGAPRLRAFPRLRSKEGTSLLVDLSPKGLEQPRILAPYGRASTLTVGSTTYTTESQSELELVTDPKRSASGPSLTLPFADPRSYWKHTGLGAVTYEGVISNPTQARVGVVTGRDYPRKDVAGLAEDQVYGVLDSGPGASLCSYGLEDSQTVLDRAEGLRETIGSSAGELSDRRYREQFARDYGDYVELLEPLLDDTHEYWQKQGDTCGEEYRGAGVSGREACQLTFGANAEGQTRRDFRIVRAFDDSLLVEPRSYQSNKERRALLEMLDCCFPDATWYVPRAAHQWVYREASTLSHNVEAAPSGECRRSVDPARERLGFRAFEISCEGDDCEVVGSPPTASLATCVLDSTSDAALSTIPSVCRYEGLTAQFSIYRGQRPSVRDMEFSWVVNGGFSPYVVPMTAFGVQKQSNPQRLRYVPQVGRLIVTDGGAPSGRDNRPLAFVLMGFENASGLPDITYSRVDYYYY